MGASRKGLTLKRKHSFVPKNRSVRRRKFQGEEQ